MKTKRFLLAAGVLLAMAITISCSSVDDGGGGNEGAAISCKTDNACVEVSADACLALQGQLVASCGTSSLSSSSIGGGGSSGSGSGAGCNISDYETVEIGNQIWMAENLNCDIEGSKCHDNNPANCAIYGRLYDWNTAMEACPPSWRLPREADWNILVAAAGGLENLRAVDGWYNCGPSSLNQYKCYDIHGFAALPGGSGSDGYFGGLGKDGAWWSSSEYDDYNAYLWGMEYNDEGAFWNVKYKSLLISVRCLQD